MLFVRLFDLRLFGISSSSLCLGKAAVCDCDTPWIFLLPFFFWISYSMFDIMNYLWTELQAPVIQQSDMEETVFVVTGSGGNLYGAWDESFSGSDWMADIRGQWYLDKSVNYLVEQYETSICTPLFQSSPFKVLLHKKQCRTLLTAVH